MGNNVKEKAKEILEKNGIPFRTGTGVSWEKQEDGSRKFKIYPYLAVQIVKFGNLDFSAIATINAVGATLGLPLVKGSKGSIRLDVGAKANFDNLVDGHVVLDPMAGITVRF